MIRVRAGARGGLWCKVRMNCLSTTTIACLQVSLACLQVACAVPGQIRSEPSAPPSSRFAITNATLIDVRTGAARAGVTLLVDGNRIAAVGDKASVQIPSGTPNVDATGKFLIPGLTDTHVHLYSEWRQLPIDTAAYFAWILAGGVTSVREMSAGDGSQALSARRSAKAGGWPAPRLYISAGPQRSNDPWAALFHRAKENEVPAALGRFTELGIDGLKLSYDAPRDSALSLIRIARAAGVPVFGHSYRRYSDRPPRYYNFTMDAVRAGLGGVVHSTGVTRPSGTSETGYLTAWRSLDDRDLQTLVDTMVARGVWYEPTVLLDYYWNNQSQFDTTGLSPHHPWRMREWFVTRDTQQRRAIVQFEAAEARFIKRFHDVGGVVLAGTDDVAFPPYGVSGELCLFVEAGLSPLDALRSATLNAARAMRWDDSLGTIETGKLADIVILNANPLTNIANVRRIDAVVVDGRLLDRAALDRYLVAVGMPIEALRRTLPASCVSMART